MNDTLFEDLKKTFRMDMCLEAPKTLLWLDDASDPNKNNWKTFFCIPNPTKVVWVKSYKEFKDYIENNPLPQGINFDYDLEDDHYVPSNLWNNYGEAFKWMVENKKTPNGFDCASFLVRYCKRKGLEIPKYTSHSANPVGRDLIMGLLDFHSNKQN